MIKKQWMDNGMDSMDSMHDGYKDIDEYNQTEEI